MKTKRHTFADILESCRYKHDMRSLFDDFLTLALCAFSQKPGAGVSYDEDLYLATVARYPNEMASEVFSKLLAMLIMEMEDRFDNSSGNDILGEFYELNFCQKGSGQFFTPWHICKLMAECTKTDSEKDGPLKVLDPTCGSGRTLLAGAQALGKHNYFYGIDIDHTCVKMAALNLFLNGVFHGEIMWADALSAGDFRMSYKLSSLPFGIFRITEKERSCLWHARQSSFSEKKPSTAFKMKLPSEDSGWKDKGSQLQLF